MLTQLGKYIYIPMLTQSVYRRTQIQLLKNRRILSDNKFEVHWENDRLQKFEDLALHLDHSTFICFVACFVMPNSRTDCDYVQYPLVSHKNPCHYTVRHTGRDRAIRQLWISPRLQITQVVMNHAC